MIIGVDARAASEVKAGRGRVVRELLAAFARLPDDNRYLLYCRTPDPELELDERFEWRAIDQRDPLWHVRAARKASRACEVFFSTNSYLTTWFTRVPSVLLVYDMIAFVPGASAQRRAQAIEHLTIRRALRRAQEAICISRATERDLVERFPQARGKTSVAHLAAHPRFARRRSAEELEEVKKRYGLEKPVVLSTGTLEPRKNLPRLIEAFANLPADLRDSHLLVLVGPQGWDTEETLRRVSLRSELVKVLGYVPDEDLACLYQLCTVFCYPSLYEGFGLPLLEAMAAGAACITSDRSSLPEIGGDGARYVDPTDVTDIARALEELLRSEDQRQALRERGREIAGRFSWDRAGRVVLDRLAAAGNRAAHER
jgi:alpha-1,3-rhamnosyl/mannosyltransferase